MKKFLKRLLCLVILVVVALGGAVIAGGLSVQQALKTDVTLSDDIGLDVFNKNSKTIDTLKLKTENGGIKILQLTDLHYRNNATFGEVVGVNYIMDGFLKAQIKKMVRDLEPQLIVITGDLITYDNAALAYKELTVFFDSLDIPWTITFGNHDGEYNASKIELLNIIKQHGKNALITAGPNNLIHKLTEKDTDIAEIVGQTIYTGIGNCVIEVQNSASESKNLIYLMDSNDYVYNEKKESQKKFSTPSGGFYPMQIEWYKWTQEILKAKYKQTLPSVLFSHIPFDQETDRYGFSDTIIEIGSTNFLFSGHTHYKGGTETYKDELIQTNGVKTGINYMEDPNTGGTLITISPNGDTKVDFYNCNLLNSIRTGGGNYALT